MTDAVGRMIDESSKPIKAISGDIGKPYTTLCRELDPDDDGAKLGVETLYPIIVSVCGTRPLFVPAPVEWLCHRLRFAVLPFGFAEPDAASFQEESMQDSQKKSRAERLMLQGAHPDVVDQAYVETKAEMDQTATLYRRQWESLRHGGGKA
jgi:hypothetical protein